MTRADRLFVCRGLLVNAAITIALGVALAGFGQDVIYPAIKWSMLAALSAVGL